MSIVNINNQSTLLPPNSYVNEEEVCKNYLKDLCDELNLKESVILHFTKDWKNSTTKPYFIQIKLDDVSEDAIKFYIAKQVYLIKKDEKKQVLKKSLLKQGCVNSFLLLTIFAVGKISKGMVGGPNYIRISCAVTPFLTSFVLFISSLIFLVTAYQLFSFNWKVDMESLDFCVQKLGKEKALIAFEELHMRTIDLGKQLSYANRLKFLKDHSVHKRT